MLDEWRELGADFGITDTATEYGVSDTLTPCFVLWLARLSKQVANTLMTYGKENPGGGMQKDDVSEK